jgi:hypothetical protein
MNNQNILVQKNNGGDGIEIFYLFPPLLTIASLDES